jgi:hypothetical protein
MMEMTSNHIPITQLHVSHFFVLEPPILPQSYATRITTYLPTVLTGHSPMCDAMYEAPLCVHVAFAGCVAVKTARQVMNRVVFSEYELDNENFEYSYS